MVPYKCDSNKLSGNDGVYVSLHIAQSRAGLYILPYEFGIYTTLYQSYQIDSNFFWLT